MPIVSVVLGEGGSGGAIAIATGNRVYMLEHAIYSVISPEGAASILWRDSTRAKEAATNMKITAEDLKALGVIDGIISEPVGGAHRDPQAVTGCRWRRDCLGVDRSDALVPATSFAPSGARNSWPSAAISRTGSTARHNAAVFTGYGAILPV